jgi:ketosteroid isomerase-like protein
MQSAEERRNLELAKRYIELVGDPAMTVEDLKALLDERSVWREMPNRFAPEGRTSNYAAVLASWEKGREYLPEQTYTLRQAIASGDTVALEIGWQGKVIKALGPFPAGAVLSAQLAIFISFENGKIVSQTDYPCYDPVAELNSGKS